MKNVVSKVLKVLNVLLVLFNFLMFFAMRPCWSGISSKLGYSNSHNSFLLILPVIICIVLIIVMISYYLIFAITFKKKQLIILNSIYLFFNIALLVGIMVFFDLGAIDYARFIMRNFFISLIPVGLILLVIFFVIIYPKTKLKDMLWFKYTLISLLVIGSMSWLFKLSIHTIEYQPVVYVVEDNYQIVFSSSCKSVGWVTIDGTNYYDLSAGSQKSESKVHKIEVEQSVLDNAKKYEIHSQSVLYRGPFYGYKGKEITKSYSFRPVDTSDGIQYFAASDVHMENNATIKTRSYAENIDFIVLAGDIISLVDSYTDAQFVNSLAYNLTKGEIPVIYARGNHEVKGKYSERLHEFVGSKNGDFFYKFHLANIYGVVLDFGEDHDDDWWEYYGLVNYTQYLNNQVKMLENEVASNDYLNYDYHIAISHIPPTFINYRHNHYEMKQKITALLNNLDIDLCLSGHQHDVLVFEPNVLEPLKGLTYNPAYDSGKTKACVTDFNFPTILIGKRGYTQTDSSNLTKGKSQICVTVNVDLPNSKETVSYINSHGKKVSVVNPFFDYNYGEDIVIDLNTKAFQKI